MRPYRFTLIAIIAANAQALELPASVSVIESAGPGCCEAFWYINLNQLNFFQSADAAGWERLICAQTNSSRAGQGEPSSVLYEPDADAQHLFGIAECLWTLPDPATHVFIRGVESGVSDGTSIASVEGVCDRG